MTDASRPPDYDELIARLRRRHESGVTRTLAWRRRQLQGICALLSQCEEVLSEALYSDLGKPPMESWLTELSYVANDATHYHRRVKRWMRARRVATPMVGQPARSWIQPEPLGTVLIIGAWNYPLQLVLAPLVAAVGAGNAAVIKPSEHAPAVSRVLARRLPDYLDSEAIAVVEGGVAESSALLEQRFDHILYTGGQRVGRIVMEAAARHLTPVTLELGGKSPCIVADDAPLETTARRIAWGKFLNAGQTCIAPDYVVTDPVTAKGLTAALARVITQMYGDDPSRSPDYGRIVNQAHFDRLVGLLEGERCAVGGDYDGERRYIAPTVLRGVTPESAVMREEIFGPILPIVEVADFDAALAFAGRGDKPLAAYVFTRDRHRQRALTERVSAGNMCINDVLMFTTVPELPFGGVGASGMGQYRGEHGFRRFSHYKPVMRRGWWPDLKLRYPPYTDAKFKVLRKLR